MLLYISRYINLKYWVNYDQWAHNLQKLRTSYEARDNIFFCRKHVHHTYMFFTMYSRIIFSNSIDLHISYLMANIMELHWSKICYSNVPLFKRFINQTIVSVGALYCHAENRRRRVSTNWHVIEGHLILCK